MNDVAVTAPQYSRATARLKPLLLLVGVAAAVAVGVTVALWSRGPSYSLLFANLGTEDQAQVTQSLDAAGIVYRMEPGSSGIEVPTERLNEARLKLAGQGLPEGDGGFALMVKEPGLGVSQFMESARYQHALETELAHTIASLRPVDGARIHIAVPHQSAFVHDRHPGSASVFLQLKAGRQLSQEQVQAIVNLVASSVPELESSQVTVVDQQGRLLSSPQGTDESSLREQHFQMVQRLEDEYTQRLETLLAPLYGAGRVRAQVVAQLETSVTEETHEQYRPDSQIVRSEQTSEQTSRDGSALGGVPGALSNQPPAAGVAQPPANAAPAAAAKPGAPGAATVNTAATGAQPGATAGAAPDNISKQATRNYELDRTLAYTRQPSGRLKRLTVAVLIDNVHSVDKDGKPQTRALTDQEIAHVTALVKDAVGFDESRGDSVNVVNSSFQTEPVAPEAELEKIPLWERPWFLNLIKIVAGLVALLVLSLSVLRPLVRALITPTRTLLAVDDTRSAASNGPARVAAEAVDPGAAEAAAYEEQLARARALVNQDPKRVAQVVRTWVATDE